MFIQELIKQYNPEKIADTSIRLGYFDTSLAIAKYKEYICENEQRDTSESDDEIYEKVIHKYKTRIRDAVNEMCGLSIHTNPETICGVIRYKDLDLDDNIISDYDVFCFNKDDLDKYKPGMINKVKHLDETKENPLNPIQTYCFMFEDWKDILGYQMSEVSLHLYPMDEIITAIIHELTWFGYDYETSQKNREKEIAVLDDRMNYDPEKCISAEELFEQLEAEIDSYYDETPEEKAKRKADEKRKRERIRKIEDSLIIENYNYKIDYWDSYYVEQSE